MIRIHHQWKPDVLVTEEGLSPDMLALLRARGHTVKAGASSGSANALMRVGGLLAGAADPRQRDTLAEGYQQAVDAPQPSSSRPRANSRRCKE